MSFGWFDATEDKEFGASLARFHIEKIPLAETDKRKKASLKRQKSLSQMFQKMAQFKREHKLNIYKKAQLGNAFRWTMQEAGYDPRYIEEITKRLMLV